MLNFKPLTTYLYLLPMDNNDLNRLTNALLTAYLDKVPAMEVGAICAQFGITPGSKMFGMASDRAAQWMENGEYDLLNDHNRDKLTTQGWRDMAKRHGAVLGRDYSKVQDGYVLSKDLMSKITADFSPDDLELLKRKGHIKDWSNDPYALLDKHLGVPFFDSILSTLAIRFKALNDTQAAHYVGYLIEGMTAANPFLKDGLFFSKVFKLLGDRFPSIVSAGNLLTDSDPDIACKVWCDLLTAMEVLDLKIDDDGVFWISEANLRSLDKVWHGEAMRPALMADKLTGRGRGFGK